MQFIEVTALAGVRSAVTVFRRRGSMVTFVLYPMVHLGEPQFYAKVQARLRTAGLVVVEGVDTARTGARALTSSYQLAASRRLGLVEQRLDYRALGVPVLRPDLDAAQVAAGWRRVPRVLRLALIVFSPLYGLWLRFFGSRRALARNLAVDDLSLEEERLRTAGTAADRLDELVLDQRDQLLLEALQELHRRPLDSPLEVAVVYGAGHMPPVVRGLLRLGYRPSDGEWLTVFTFLDELD
ncbi:hypothetical protein [Streptomyces sp. TLI_171]|uniref:hypothetical protein n=1 Tax=Streptomyces sp. TLI_171 TaxID=1938859 RepID=UPI000C184AC1|nr:hypothetical protein [Streptomyces sp. TLI_171]RKE23026.1 hypothetical protein BX266_6482 [Streptomyces sp. TLI_171]